MAFTDTQSQPAFLEIIRDLREDLTSLFRQEVALAKSEVKSRALAFGKQAVFFGAAGLASLYALFFLLSALCNLIGTGLVAAGLTVMLSAWLAPLILGLLLGAGALLIAMTGMKKGRAAIKSGIKEVPSLKVALRLQNQRMRST
ncbi:MAG: phage holin family protein [Fibrobacteria bacterium]